MSFVISAVAAAIVEGATAAVILTAVSEVGMAMTVVGAVTGSKELMKAGGALGLVGGIGGMANSMFGAAVDGAVAAGSTAGAYSDVAGEQFAQGAASAAGNATTSAASVFDAAGNLTGDAASTSAVAAPSADLANSALDINAGAIPAGVPPPLDASLSGSPQYAAQSATGSPTITAPGAPAASGAPTADATGTINASATQGDVGAGAYGDDAGYNPTAPTAPTAPGSLMDSLKNGVDSTSAWFKSLKPQAQAEFAKSLLAIPGGIQVQKNKAAELAIAQQHTNQTSYGSSVPTFGIIAKAQKG